MRPSSGLECAERCERRGEGRKGDKRDKQFYGHFISPRMGSNRASFEDMMRREAGSDARVDCAAISPPFWPALPAGGCRS